MDRAPPTGGRGPAFALPTCDLGSEQRTGSSPIPPAAVTEAPGHAARPTGRRKWLLDVVWEWPSASWGFGSAANARLMPGYRSARNTKHKGLRWRVSTARCQQSLTRGANSRAAGLRECRIVRRSRSADFAKTPLDRVQAGAIRVAQPHPALGAGWIIRVTDCIERSDCCRALASQEKASPSAVRGSGAGDFPGRPQSRQPFHL